MAPDNQSGVVTALGRDSISATIEVDAPPGEVFDFLRRPANHALISGDQTVRSVAAGPAAVGLGDRFGMKMKLGVPYRMTSEVVEFDADRLIAWSHFGGHRWRWEVDALPDGRSVVTETFDLAPARAPALLRLVGYPKRHEANVVNSVVRLAEHFSGV